jgi:hypothetical protein
LIAASPGRDSDIDPTQGAAEYVGSQVKGRPCEPAEVFEIRKNREVK